MKTRIAISCLAVAMVIADAFSQDEAAFRPRRLVTAPSGKFHIDWVEEGLAIVTAETKGEAPNLLPEPRDVADRESVPETPFVFVSPDSHWVFVAWRTRGPMGYSPDAVTELYRINVGNDLRAEFATKERFDKLAWRFMAQSEGIKETAIAQPADESSARDIAFAAWSSDSVRLLVSLSANIGAPEVNSLPMLKPGIGSWLCYFNTRTGQFELTERLMIFNRGARKRWRDQFVQVGRETFPLAAEALAQEGPWHPPKERLERADRRLNELYSALLKQLPPAAQAQLRQDEREWLIQRDTEASIYAHQSWSPAPEAALIEGRAIATEARVAELQKRVEKKEKATANPNS